MKSIARKMLLLLCLLVITGGILAHAALPVDQRYKVSDPTRYNYINSLSIAFDIISNRATVDTFVSARNCTSIKQTVEFQIKMSGKWTVVDTWEKTDSGTWSHFYNNDWSVYGGENRFVMYVDIYVGSSIVEHASLASSVR